METKIMQIFYDNNALPYKDKERQVHYPIIGQSFSGASLTTEIRFYTKEIGGVDNITWVANAKRPDGKIAYQQLESNYDSEVEESYVSLQLSQWFTEKKGDLFIALNGYAGGVDIQVDEDSGLYTVSGTPIIQATGSIKIIIAYAPIMNNGYGAVPEITVQQALGAVANKLDKQNTPSTVYGVNAESEQVMLPYSLQATPSTLVRRDLAGQINVPLTPTDNANATSKGYVDTFGKSIELTMDSDYKLSLTLKDANGNVLGTTQVVDLPLESVVVGGSYDSVNKALVLTLENGNTISIPVGDLISGLVSEEQLEDALANKQDTLVSGENIKTLNGTTLLGNGNYEFDIAFDENSTNALQNKVISREVREINYQIAVIREELFESVLTEIDYTVDFATLYAIPDTLSDDDGTHRVVYSETQLKRIDGNTIQYNQLMPNNQVFPSASGIAVSYDSSTHRYTITTSSTGYATSNANWSWINGHKYLLKVNVISKTSNANIRLRFPILTESLTNTIFSPTTYLNLFGIQAMSSDGNEATIEFELQLFDLTAMSLDNLTTVDEVRSALLSRGINIDEYNPYSSGELRTGTYNGIKVNGYNLFDKDNIDYNNDTYLDYDGSLVGSQNYNSTISYIEIKPNQTYNLENANPSQGSNPAICFYDINKDFISGIKYMGSNNLSFTTPANAFYCRFSIGKIATNVSLHLQGTRTGYAPYIAPITISVPTTELKSAGSVHDYIEIVEGNVVEGEQLYNLVKHTLVGSVDLGSLSFGGTGNSVYYATLSNAKSNTGLDNYPNILCENYETVVAKSNNYWINTETRDKIISLGYDTNRVYVRDTSITQASDIQGILYYELATPTEEVIATNLRFDEITSRIEQGGSIEPIYTNVAPNITTTFVVKKAVGE